MRKLLLSIPLLFAMACYTGPDGETDTEVSDSEALDTGNRAEDRDEDFGPQARCKNLDEGEWCDTSYFPENWNQTDAKAPDSCMWRVCRRLSTNEKACGGWHCECGCPGEPKC